MTRPGKVLFVCNQGRLRSRTAAALFSRTGGIEVRFGGVDRSAARVVTEEDLRWADQMFVFEKRQRNILQKRFPALYRVKPMECLYVPDEYDYMAPDLVELLLRKLGKYLGAPAVQPNFDEP